MVGWVFQLWEGQRLVGFLGKVTEPRFRGRNENQNLLGTPLHQIHRTGPDGILCILLYYLTQIRWDINLLGRIQDLSIHLMIAQTTVRCGRSFFE